MAVNPKAVVDIAVQMADVYLDWREVGGVSVGDAAKMKGVGSLKDMAMNMDLSGLLNLAAIESMGMSFKRASGDSVSAITAAEALAAAKIFAQTAQEESQSMNALKNYIANQNAQRQAALQEGLQKKAAVKRKQIRKGPVTKRDFSGGKLGKAAKVPMMPPEEEGVAPEEEAPVPGGAPIAPAATPPSGPTLEGTPDTTDTEAGEELGEEDEDKSEDEIARELAEEKKETPEEEQEERVVEEEREEIPEQPAAKPEVSEAAAQKATQRELDAQKRISELEGKVDKDRTWEERMLRATTIGPIPGNLLYFWVAVSALIAGLPGILVGEVFTLMANFGYINLHAFIDLLPFKVSIPWGDIQVEFDELSWREWIFIGLMDGVIALIILGIAALWMAIIKLIIDPSELVNLGYSSLVALFTSIGF